MNINKERLAASFTDLCQISSPSKQEKQLAERLKIIFAELGADTILEDNSASKTGSDTGNLIIRFWGDKKSTPIMLACHMDTVHPCENVIVKREDDIFTSAGETILGADDKSGIAVIIEMLSVIKENDWQHTPLEIVLTTCEEIGLLGANHLEYDTIESKYGIALDSSGVNTIITNAPAANKFKITINGLAAHAGLSPEDGVNALQIAAIGIANANLGRLDEISTANIGVIAGGMASNIVPDKVVLKGEARSHSDEKLETYTSEIIQSFQNACDLYKDAIPGFTPTMEVEKQAEYKSLAISKDNSIVSLIKNSAKKIGKEVNIDSTGGGSDANAFNQHGIETVILGTGMDKVHSTQERIDLNDMVDLTELLLMTICPK